MVLGLDGARLAAKDGAGSSTGETEVVVGTPAPNPMGTRGRLSVGVPEAAELQVVL